jgi:hypothetical protein
MANSLTGPRWKIDTAGSTVLYSSMLFIAEMRFIPGAEGDDLVVTDANGAEVWTVTNALTGGIAGSEEYDGRSKPPIYGLKVTTLTAGAILYIWPR